MPTIPHYWLVQAEHARDEARTLRRMANALGFGPESSDLLRRAREEDDRAERILIERTRPD